MLNAFEIMMKTTIAECLSEPSSPKFHRINALLEFAELLNEVSDSSGDFFERSIWMTSTPDDVPHEWSAEEQAAWVEELVGERGSA